MCDLFEANPWKPLLCTNCHQNRSGHSKMSTSTSSMHLYEEIMAQYFTNNPTETDHLTSTSLIESESTTENVDLDVEEDDSFSDEEQQMIKSTAVEFIPNQSMINTQGIVLIGPDLKSSKETTKKSKKIHLLRKTKSNADECLKKNENNENTSSKLRWFKAKKSPGTTTPEANKGSTSPPTPSTNPSARIRVLPEINKLTLNEALNIARRQHSSLKPTPQLKTNIRSPVTFPLGHYASSIGSTTSSSTHSSNEYESQTSEATYLVATAPMETNPTSITSDSIIRSTLERLTSDLGSMIDEYKNHLPVAQFQTLKSLFHQQQSTKIFSNESICFLLLQLIDELTTNANSSTFEHFLIAHHSNLPIVVRTTGTMKNDDQSMEQIIRDFAQPISSTTDLTILENLCLKTLATQFLQYSSADFDQPLSNQRMKILDLFWTQIPSVRHVQINEENERILFLLYFFMRRLI